jgi:membrane protein implicated in regulation of membrane protease activity
MAGPTRIFVGVAALALAVLAVLFSLTGSPLQGLISALLAGLASYYFLKRRR